MAKESESGLGSAGRDRLDATDAPAFTSLQLSARERICSLVVRRWLSDVWPWERSDRCGK